MVMNKLILTGCLSFLLFSAADTHAQTINSQQAKFKVETIADGLSYPWSMSFIPGNGYLVTERDGRLWHVGQTGEKTEIKGVPDVQSQGQGGLLEIALSPDFEKDNLVYLSYAGGTRFEFNTELARAKLDLKTNTLSDLKVIFKAEPKMSGGNHFGGKILFLPDGTLLLTLGERNRKDEAQKTNHHLGKIVRLNRDGSIPQDNPFVGKADFKPEIFTYGNRNVQGIALQPGTNRIWEHEHGPKGGDEVNILKPGANYGWPAITYGVNYTGFKITDKTQMPGMEQPVIHWTPSIAPSGMAFYDGDHFPQWKGDIFVGALAGTHLRRLEVKGDKITGQEVLLADMEERIRDVRNGPDGYIYLLTDSVDGRLIRLSPAP